MSASKRPKVLATCAATCTGGGCGGGALSGGAICGGVGLACAGGTMKGTAGSPTRRLPGAPRGVPGDAPPPGGVLGAPRPKRGVPGEQSGAAPGVQRGLLPPKAANP